MTGKSTVSELVCQRDVCAPLNSTVSIRHRRRQRKHYQMMHCRSDSSPVSPRQGSPVPRELLPPHIGRCQ